MRAKSILVLLVATFILGTTVPLVYADPWSAIENSGYAITVVDPPHGTEVLVGTTVRVRAGTTHYIDEDVKTVTFRWMPPTDSGLAEIFNSTVPLSASSPPEYTRNGDLIYDAFANLTINVLGDWGVQAWFHDSQGNIRHRTDIISIRATSFLSVPEVPFGTIATILAMLGALSLFAIKKKVFVPKR